jgi:rifampicin phosphotransferase
MLGERWITDRTPTERFPDYTRANAGEVLADPVTPLGWDFCWENGVVLGCRDGFVSFGVFDADEYGTPPESFGSFGGYFYNTLTQARLMGVRMPGASPEAIDQAYFDNHPDVPVYKAEPWHDSPRHAEKLGETMGFLFSTETYKPIDDQKVLAKQARDSRPDLGAASIDDLLARARSLQPLIQAMFEQHVWASLGASFGPGAIQALTAELGRPTDAIKLVTGIGDVDSAEIARTLWTLSRLVRSDLHLTGVFDAGLDGVIAATNGTAFGEALAQFIYEHGSRGPNEWDAGQPSYETNPRIAIAQIDALRKQNDSADPMVSFAKNQAERARIEAEVGAALADNAEAAGTFAAAMKSGALFLAARERCKGNNIRAIHEVRMCFDEIARRMVAAGHIAAADHFWMLREAELPEFVANPASFTATLASRAEDFKALGELEPPFIVKGVCPTLSEWKRKADLPINAVAAGQVLTGTACAPGNYTGVARVLLRADDPGALEPGDILVTIATDPSWTPLFLAAGAVVANVGALGSHASIVSRELGIPCVASVADATRRIPDGAVITVDGTNGTVTIDTLP